MKEFYQLLQLNPDKIKQKAKESTGWKGKCYYSFVVAFRAVLIVLCAVLFVTVLQTIFGEENSAFAVVLFVMLLTMRFVDFGYRIKEELAALAVILAILVFMPAFSVMVPPVAGLFIDFFSILAILLLACQNPRMGYGGLFCFAYIYLVGNPVSGTGLLLRAGMGVAGFAICGAILYHHHHAKKTEVTFVSLLKNFSFRNTTTLWMIRASLGVSLLLMFAVLFSVGRYMWMGFACSTLLAQAPYSGDVHKRFIERVQGAVVGASLFLLLFTLVPDSMLASMLTIVGLLGGVALGFCSDYRWKTIIICFGALSIAAEIYGVAGAVVLRIFDNVAGALFGLIFAWLFHVIVTKHLIKETEKKPVAA